MMDENKLDEAVLLFQQSIALDPHFKSHELLGECYILLNRLQEAIVHLTEATRLNSGVRAPSLLAEAFLKLKDFTRAVETAEIALSRDPNNRRARRIKKLAAEIEE